MANPECRLWFLEGDAQLLDVEDAFRARETHCIPLQSWVSRVLNGLAYQLNQCNGRWARTDMYSAGARLFGMAQAELPVTESAGGIVAVVSLSGFCYPRCE